MFLAGKIFNEKYLIQNWIKMSHAQKKKDSISAHRALPAPICVNFVILHYSTP